MTDHDLLYYVQRLTLPYHDVVVQTHRYTIPGKGIHEIACVSHTDNEGLLKQLRGAVYSGIGRRATSGAGSDRVPIDEGAIALYERIERQAGEAYVNLVQKPVPLALETTLNDWYRAHTDAVRKGQITDDDDTAALHRAHGWVEQIEAYFNPPRRLELTVEHEWEEPITRDVRSYTGKPRTETILVTRSRRVPAPCPECRERYATDEDSGNRILAMVLEYWELGPETFGHLRATCRACNHEWHGKDAARSLMVAIDETDQDLQAREVDETELARARGVLGLDTPTAHNYVQTTPRSS